MSYIREIESLRKRNDRLNKEIVEKIADWVKAFRKIGPRKEEFVLDYVQRLADKHKLDVDGIKRIFQAMIGLINNSGDV